MMILMFNNNIKYNNNNIKHYLLNLDTTYSKLKTVLLEYKKDLANVKFLNNDQNIYA